MEIKSVIIIGLFVVIAILIIIEFSLLNSLSGYQSVANVTFPKNTLLNIQKAVIYPSNPYGVFPNDKLLLQITVSKEIPDFITIKPLIYTTVGDVPVKISENQKWQGLESDQPQTFSYEFFAGTEGQNIVKVAINTTNPTEKIRFIEFINGTSNSFDVMSTSDRLLSSQNTMILIGIMVSGVGSAIALSLTAYQTKLSRDEKNQTIRAWIGQKLGASFEPVRIYNEKDEIKTLDEWGKLTKIEMQNFNPSVYEFVMTLKNFGQIPAFDVRPRFVCSLNQDRKELNEEEWWEPGEIMPDDEAKYTLPIPVGFYEKAQIDHNFKFYMIFELKYRSGNLKDEKIYGFINEFRYGGITKISHWDEKRDFSKDSDSIRQIGKK